MPKIKLSTSSIFGKVLNTNLPDPLVLQSAPTQDMHAATKKYVDDSVGSSTASSTTSYPWTLPVVVAANAGTSNASYTLPSTGEEMVLKGGAIQVRDTDYTKSGDVITFVAGNIPVAGESVIISIGRSTNTRPTILTANVGSSNASYTLPSSGLETVWKGGAVQINEVDYTKSGNVITFVAGNIPLAGEQVVVTVS